MQFNIDKDLQGKIQNYQNELEFLSSKIDQIIDKSNQGITQSKNINNSKKRVSIYNPDLYDPKNYFIKKNMVKSQSLVGLNNFNSSNDIKIEQEQSGVQNQGQIPQIQSYDDQIEVKPSVQSPFLAMNQQKFQTPLKNIQKPIQKQQQQSVDFSSIQPGQFQKQFDLNNTKDNNDKTKYQHSKSFTSLNFKTINISNDFFNQIKSPIKNQKQYQPTLSQSNSIKDFQKSGLNQLKGNSKSEKDKNTILLENSIQNIKSISFQILNKIQGCDQFIFYVSCALLYLFVDQHLIIITKIDWFQMRKLLLKIPFLDYIQSTHQLINDKQIQIQTIDKVQKVLDSHCIKFVEKGLTKSMVSPYQLDIAKRILEYIRQTLQYWNKFNDIQNTFFEKDIEIPRILQILPTKKIDSTQQYPQASFLVNKKAQKHVEFSIIDIHDSLIGNQSTIDQSNLNQQNKNQNKNRRSAQDRKNQRTQQGQKESKEFDQKFQSAVIQIKNDLTQQQQLQGYNSLLLQNKQYQEMIKEQIKLDRFYNKYTQKYH